ncbi:DUF6249 domain-containing protein [Plebeiibacterium sediminum]|uniref:DUF6249 domain-containing protein n=1 Tax=Plebeiibacterium sediminum TaxID=2992112 RepID=A0AAE3M9I9_9BACT|nr:DUF6249 domain-containing protein [Plebeiobacterium sediminum]MCW3789324.1 hypothetical protein [Plebeiobacterium sediminum]
MQEVFITAVLFTGFYFIIKMFTDYLLKRRIVKSGHIEKADILQPVQQVDDEPQTLKSLKWALVATMAGLGLIVAYVVGNIYGLEGYHLERSMISFGIELLFIGLGFLIYFFVAIKHKK